MSDRLDLQASRSIDTSACRTVCLAVGPYRNLTTLTAATLFLHPNCEVLNHAGKRIYRNPEVNFLADFSEEKLTRFLQFAIRISKKGGRGGYGGSITKSHAFDDKHQMRELYESSGLAQEDAEVHCLFWKESLLTSNLIREKQIDMQEVFDRSPQLRFLLPIRNPLDCAVSNLKTGHVRHFIGLDETAELPQVVDAILGEIQWFASMKEAFPDRFFHYYEHTISREMLLELAAFLQLEPLEKWLSVALQGMVTKVSYDQDPELLTHYRASVQEKFARYPKFAEGLLQFCESPEVVQES